jgi:hypothetical protein
MYLSAIEKFNMEDDFYKALLLKIVFYYKTKKHLLLNLEKGLYGLAIIDNSIIEYKKEDLKRYKDQFRNTIFKESLKSASYHFINKQMEKNDAKKKLKDVKYRLTEKNSLNKTIKLIVDTGLFGKNQNEVMKKSYDYYNETYTEKIDISKKSVFDDIRAVTMYATYLHIFMNWDGDDIDELMEKNDDGDLVYDTDTYGVADL